MLVPILVVVGLAFLIPIIIEVSAAVGMNASLGKRGDGSVSIKYPLPSEQKDLVYKKDYFYMYRLYKEMKIATEAEIRMYEEKYKYLF